MCPFFFDVGFCFPPFLALKYNTLVNILVYFSLNLCVRICLAWKFKEDLLEYRGYVFLSLLDPAKMFSIW